MSQVVCLYHGDCYDGLGAAWAFSKKFPDAQFIPVEYKKPFPDGLEGKIVYIVDFCYPLADLVCLSALAAEIHVLDHHKGMDSVIEDYNWTVSHFGWDPAKFNAIFDASRSGAKLTWETLLPEYATPLIIDFISDRDLWAFELDETEAVMAGLGTYPMDLKVWDRLFQWDPTFDNKHHGDNTDNLNHPHYSAMNALEDAGYPILRKMQMDIDRIINLTKRNITLEGYEVPIINVPRTLVSEAVGQLAKDQPFAVGYFDTATYREFSLRSVPGGMDLIPIAKALGGGGHPHACGFRVDRDHPLAQF